MASGLSLATSSISIPPAALAMNTGRPLARSTSRPRYSSRFIPRACQLYTPALAAAPGVNLRFHRNDVGLQALRRLARFFLGVSNLATRRGHTVTRQDGLSLILVNLHHASISARICASAKQRSLLGRRKGSKDAAKCPQIRHSR